MQDREQGATNKQEIAERIGTHLLGLRLGVLSALRRARNQRHRQNP